MREFERTKLPVRFAKQRTPYTCAPKALQMIINFHVPNEFDLRQGLEIEIFERAKLGKYNAATSPGLALFALEHGFPVDHLVKFEDAFKYPEKPLSGYTMPAEEFEEKRLIDEMYFEKAKAKGLKTIVVPDLADVSALMKDYLKRDVPLLAMIDNGGRLHDLVIRGFYGSTYLTIDPGRGEVSVAEKNLVQNLDTRYGMSILAIYPRPDVQKND